MFKNIIKQWEQFLISIKERIRRALQSTDIPYFIHYVAAYRTSHCLNNFAGNLAFVKEQYVRTAENDRQKLSDQFNAIIHNLVMPNGVKKTTYSMRQGSILSAIFGEMSCRIPKEHIKVLDIPSSAGTASLNLYEVLTKHYKISSYVLGDLYFKIYYDRERECIYDEEWNLLQKRFRKQFFSIYQPHGFADVYHIAPQYLLLPFKFMSWYLTKKYKHTADTCAHPIMLLHPDVERRVSEGVFNIRKINVFENIGEQYDLIISFNLLQRNYFPQAMIQKGVDNFKNALNENGLLIMGDTVSFSALMKKEGELLQIMKNGDF